MLQLRLKFYFLQTNAAWEEHVHELAVGCSWKETRTDRLSLKVPRVTERCWAGGSPTSSALLLCAPLFCFYTLCLNSPAEDLITSEHNFPCIGCSCSTESMYFNDQIIPTCGSEVPTHEKQGCGVQRMMTLSVVPGLDCTLELPGGRREGRRAF